MLAGFVAARATVHVPSVLQERGRGRGQGAGDRGGHSWMACPSTDM